MKKKTNTAFYEFDYILNNQITGEKIQSLINGIGMNGSDKTIKQSDINYSVTSIQSIDSVSDIPESLKGNNIFHFRIVRSSDKGVYASDLDYSNFDENNSHAGDEIEKEDGKFIIDREFQFILKLEYISDEGKIRGHISVPKITGLIGKDTLKNLLKEVLDSTFGGYSDNELNVQNYGFLNVTQEIDFESVLTYATEMRFNQRIVIDKTYQELLGLDQETDEIEIKVLVKEKSSISKILKICMYLQENKKEDKNYLINDISVKTPQGVFTFDGGLCYAKELNLNFIDGNLDSDYKTHYINEISKAINSL